MEIKVIVQEEKFLEIKDKWNEIVSHMKVSSPFQTWEWNYNWWCQVENKECELLIIEAFEGKSVYGYAPFIIKEKDIEFIGDKHFDYGAFICAERKREIIQLFLKHAVEMARERKLQVALKCFTEKGDQLEIGRAHV